MSLSHSPSIVTTGLVLAYDMNNTGRSWRGAPTTNYISSPTNEVIASNEFAAYADLSPIFDTYGEGYYSISADIKSAVAGGITVYTASGAVEYNIGYYNAACETYYKRFYFDNILVTRTDPGASVSNLSFYGGYGSGLKPSIKNVQVEKTSFCSPFVIGTRTNTQSLLDITGQHTLTSSLTYASDNTFSFASASSNAIVVPLSTGFNKLTGSLNFWAYPTSYNGGNGYFVNRDDATANAVDWLWVGPYSGTFYFRLGDGSSCCANDLTIGSWSTVAPINTWINLCFTWTSAGTSVIYKNGEYVTSRAISAIPSTNPTSTGRIGLGHANADSFFNGKIATTHIYNRQLTATEVAQNFQATRGRYGL